MGLPVTKARREKSMLGKSMLPSIRVAVLALFVAACAGDAGPTGPAGPAGQAGQAGQDGSIGPPGQDGSIGPPGQDGASGAYFFVSGVLDSSGSGGGIIPRFTEEDPIPPVVTCWISDDRTTWLIETSCGISYLADGSYGVAIALSQPGWFYHITVAYVVEA